MTHSKISEDLKWMDQARCRFYDPEIWFPSKDHRTRQIAKRICAECPVLYECRVFSISANQAQVEYGLEGIWGGLSRGERRNIKKARYYLAEARRELANQPEERVFYGYK